ncbi:MAG: adenylyltransferase/cytidyltransferase family protein [Verrucomicrobiota bacterium]|nr:adenylyltransferase/cytidyltransferase family protein [Verrucomicrobiota bacterium]
MGSENKIILWEQLEAWREEVRARGQKLVVTNGCFDILHTGHVVYLENARTEADLLLVGVDSDASVRSLKGPSRPVNGQEDRARLVAALEAVSAVCIFEGIGALGFLRRVKPDVYVKGGDYKLETLLAEEREFLQESNTRIVFSPMVAGKSTTGLIKKFFTAPTEQKEE